MMNINFEDEFLNNIIKLNIMDKYFDEYLQTTRHNLLQFTNLKTQLDTIKNNYIINNNKYYYIFIDNVKKESLQFQLKQIILKQRKLYTHFLHYCNITYPNLQLPKNENIKNEKKKSNFKTIQTHHQLYNITQFFDKKNTMEEKKESFIQSTPMDKGNFDDKRSIRSIRSISSLRSEHSISSKKSNDSSESSKKSYKINRPASINSNNTSSSTNEIKKNKFAKFFVKRQNL